MYKYNLFEQYFIFLNLLRLEFPAGRKLEKWRWQLKKDISHKGGFLVSIWDLPVHKQALYPEKKGIQIPIIPPPKVLHLRANVTAIPSGLRKRSFPLKSHQMVTRVCKCVKQRDTNRDIVVTCSPQRVIERDIVWSLNEKRFKPFIKRIEAKHSTCLH